ncbi:MAG TPA: class I SAM-dependent methyltransferase [Ktedonobacterales bacterium]|nr:class I SAM-dependent methyltransferase [Ktedonobacterales bacterium]
MPHKFDTRNRNLLLSEERHEALKPEELLRSLGLKRGQTMADIGCGPGFFTVPAATIVGPRGLVIAGDVQGEMLSAVRSRVAEQGLENVRVVKTSDMEVPLPPGTCDLVLLAFILDEVPQRARFLHRAARLAKPSGRIAVLEWEKHETPVGPPLEDRISPEELIADAAAAGLTMEEQRALNEHQYLCVFVPAAH